MANKEVAHGNDARLKIQKGIDLVADIVKVTLGPRGRNVVLDTNRFAPPQIINDGVRIAREVSAKGRLQDVGARLVKAVASKTDDVAGDGTTTASILVQSIVAEGMQLLATKADAVNLRQGIETAAAEVIEEVKKHVIKTEDLESLTAVATISCGDPELGKLIAELVKKVGPDGVVTIEDSDEEKTKSRVAQGIELRGGLLLPVFINNQARQQSELEDVPIFVTDHDLTNGLEIVKLMEAASSDGFKQAVLIANSVQGEAMIACVSNWLSGKFKLLPVRVQAYGEQGREVMRDMAAACDAKFYAKDEGNKLPADIQGGFNISDFGHADKVIATKDRTTIMGSAGDKDERIKALEAQVKNSQRGFEREQIKERIAKLQSGVGVVRVGGVSETEKEERKLRVEDAIKASKAALAAGVVAGGGAALYHAAKKVAQQTENASAGHRTVLLACEVPMRQMAENSGIELDRSDLKQIAENPGKTIDFNNGDLVDAKTAGIIDPYKVVQAALKNAASIAALFLTAEGVVSADFEDSEKL